MSLQHKAIRTTLFISMLLVAYTCFSQNIAEEEAKLYRLINEYRAQNNLPSIPLSPSLTFVAQTHAWDLAVNHPDMGSCNAHSWSDKGRWTPVCYTGDHAKANLMWSKPGELTSYKGSGFEIAYGAPSETMPTAQAALQSWKGSSGHNDVIINRGIWKNAWKAVGIGINRGYAVVWFGQEPDNATPPVQQPPQQPAVKPATIPAINIPADKTPLSNTATVEENKLYTLLMDYRAQNNLPSIPRSNSLTTVAKAHAMDLVNNRPDLNGCGLFSWSNKGNWTACCYGPGNANCMWNKPRELTSYKGNGYEMASFNSSPITADFAFKTWQNMSTNNLFINQGVWQSHPWKSIGIAIYGGFAIAWVGEESDNATSPSTNRPVEKPAPQIPQKPQAQTNTNSGLNITAAQTDALNFHNKVRSEVGVTPLQWSPQLAAFAQLWANQLVANGCKLDHRPRQGEWKQQYGENVYWSGGNDNTPLSASENWYSEIKDFTGVQSSKTGHYTQMVWRNTTKLGIASAKCPNGATIIVANYDPSGNVAGEKPL